MYCKKCGQELFGNNTNCTKCGEPINSDNNSSFEYCKLILTREKAFVASLVKFDIYIDNIKVGKIKNGETVEFNVSRGQHRISINNNNEIDIMINGNTTANVVVFGVNNFGINSINGQDIKSENGIPSKSIEKSKKLTNYLLYSSIGISILSILGYFFLQLIVQEWFYGIFIGLAIINMVGLKKQKNIDEDELKKLKMKNIVAIVISIIAIILTLMVSVPYY